MLSVQVLTRETIKPSTPTPPHLKFLELSFVDQCLPNYSINVILFYSAGHSNGIREISHHLRSSLSDVLTRFYSLAGRLKKHHPSSDKIYVECNDEGVEFTTSRVERDLYSFLADPPINELGLLFPGGGSSSSSYDEPPLSVQFNEFTPGGGWALGVSMSHKLADGTSYAEFLKAWADTARGRGDPARRPKFESAALFPQRDVQPPEIEFMPVVQSIIAPARLLIRARQLEKLRGYARERARPTRVEAVIALLWRCAIRAAGGVARGRRVEAAVPVNLRPRLRPPLTEDCFGNIFAMVYASGGVERYLFTSWCRFPFYETDFGWGGPAWVAVPPCKLKNCFVLMNARGGDGFEVWAFLTEAEMEGFAKDPELLAFTSSPGSVFMH
ncbi:BAHD acyltransferase [Acorus gramineus]|uniref:BAHD acyltransferase n=1 Tax=Acorus gramineus TaxID=55184 RepID=A0AAV9B552_ACOGR|nr:BAHD acyltransferase [Acorus gramineus]